MVGNIIKEEGIFAGGAFQAIVGMAYPVLAEKGVTPVFDNLMKNKALKSNMFSFYLTRTREHTESDITFGYYDKSKFKGQLDWHPIRYKYMYAL
mmetsp:Transcript_29546/g.45017  ORF Transcript_29546/g.45017 Transcript_29546/m.45017 type:complete len:94 (+) Transcript_29546:732-1013(+)